MRDISQMEAYCVCGEALTVTKIQVDMRPGKEIPSKVIVSPCCNADCKSNPQPFDKDRPPVEVVRFYHLEDFPKRDLWKMIIDDRPPRRKRWS